MRHFMDMPTTIFNIEKIFADTANLGTSYFVIFKIYN